jgi:hypothetical protein
MCMTQTSYIALARRGLTDYEESRPRYVDAGAGQVLETLWSSVANGDPKLHPVSGEGPRENSNL